VGKNKDDELRSICNALMLIFSSFSVKFAAYVLRVEGSSPITRCRKIALDRRFVQNPSNKWKMSLFHSDMKTVIPPMGALAALFARSRNY